MLDMDQVTSIRHAVLVLGRSRRWASRNFQVARETVDRYLEGAEPGKRKASPRASPKRVQAAAALAAVVAETAVAKKQQLTVQRAHELVRARGVDVGYTLIKQLVRQERRAAKEVYVPLAYRPGDLGEVDFFEVVVDVDGVRTTAWLFLMRMMFSSRDFCWIYPRQDQVCFLDGHVRAFAHFGRVPTRLAYDNLKAAVLKHLLGSERCRLRLIRFRGHPDTALSAVGDMDVQVQDQKDAQGVHGRVQGAGRGARALVRQVHR